MKKILLIAIALSVTMFSCTSTKVEYSSLGKNGPINLKIAAHSRIDTVDGEPTKLKSFCKLEPGFHSFGVNYAHYTSSYSATAFVNKEFYFEEGKNYTMKAIESNSFLYLPIRDDSPVISETYYFAKAAEEPEKPSKRILWLKTFPKDRAFEVVGTFETRLSGSIFSSSSLTSDMAQKYLESFVANSEYDVDAFVDAYSYRGMTGETANAVGIKFIDSEENQI